MKLKKALAIFMASTLGLASLTGCSEATTNYTKEVAKSAQWTSSEIESQGTMSIDVQGQKFNISFTGNGCTSGNKSYYEIKFNDTSGIFKLPEIEVYTDNGVTYINKSYFENLYTLSGQKVPEKLDKVNAKYIGIDSGMNVADIQKAISNPDAILSLGKTIFGNSNIDLPYVQNGREFTLKLNSDEMVDLIVKAIKSYAGNIENINNSLKLGLSSEEISKIKSLVNYKDIDTKSNELKILIAGSNLSLKDSFTDDGYTHDMNLSIQLKNIGKISVISNGKAVKVDKKEIAIPTNVIKLKKAEFNKLLS